MPREVEEMREELRETQNLPEGAIEHMRSIQNEQTPPQAVQNVPSPHEIQENEEEYREYGQEEDLLSPLYQDS